jgi:hypothetical protein
MRFVFAVVRIEIAWSRDRDPCEFMQTHAEKLIQDPVKRAVLQRDVWAVFDWSASREPERSAEPSYEREKRDLQIRSPHKGSSRAELPQVMIQMLVHSATPVLRRKGAKKRMRMPGAVPFSTLVELAHLHLKLFLFSKKFPLI